MIYKSITDFSALERANKSIVSALRSAATKKWKAQRIIFRPGYKETDAYWLGNHGFWFATIEKDDHFWIPVGVVQPDGKTSLRITLEINTPKQFGHGRAGLILEGGNNQLFLAHTGRIGGGISGINRTAFLKHRGPLRKDTVEYDGGKLAILLGSISDRNMVHHIARFVHEVSQFKKEGPAVDELKIHQTLGKQFEPKFIGITKRKARSEEQISLLHDLVCETLNAKLGPSNGYSDKQRDLYLRNNDGTMSVLYEVKTDCSTTSIYTAVGQLLINGWTRGDSSARLVLVMPGRPDQRTLDALKSYDIFVLSYEWRGNKPCFPKKCDPRLF